MQKLGRLFRELCRNLLFGIKTSFLASKKYFLMKCFLLLSGTAIPLITIWLWKEILNGIMAADRSLKKVAIYLAVYFSLKLFSYILAQFDGYVGTRYSDELQFYIEGVMIEKTSRMDLKFFDSAEMGDKVRRARSNFSVLTNSTWLVFNILSGMINIIITVSIVCAYKWWIGIMTVVLMVPFFIYNKKYTDKRLRMEKEQLRDSRMKDYFGDAFVDNGIQFEIKLNHIGEYFLSRYRELWQRIYKAGKREDIRFRIVNTVIIIFLNMSAEFFVLILSAAGVLSGRIGIGDLQYNLSMVTRLREQVSGLIGDINRFLGDNTRLNELREFIMISSERERSGEKLPSANPKIEFCNVSFRYPNSAQYILKDCSFIIEPHEKISLIGLNGAGKSTVIKLMFRFYDPESGCIKLDGTDIKEYNVYAVRKIFGVLFQDFVTYCIPLREIIALSDFPERHNDEKLRKACDISGASEIIKDWENGFDSVLGRFYADNGKDLSGGQWQLVSLARAYFKETEYMILDEPSAALDPLSEDRIFKQMYDLSEGKSAVTITHRLSGAILANKILVLSDGHITEQGTHAELIGQGGEYARLFQLQASKYV